MANVTGSRTACLAELMSDSLSSWTGSIKWYIIVHNPKCIKNSYWDIVVNECQQNNTKIEEVRNTRKRSVMDASMLPFPCKRA